MSSLSKERGRTVPILLGGTFPVSTREGTLEVCWVSGRTVGTIRVPVFREERRREITQDHVCQYLPLGARTGVGKVTGKDRKGVLRGSGTGLGT